MNFSDYSDSLGKIGEGPLHGNRIQVLGMSLARNDVVGTIFMGLFMGVFTIVVLSIAMKLKLSIINTLIFWLIVLSFWLVVMFLLGIILHALFGVKTALNTTLFFEKKEE